MFMSSDPVIPSMKIYPKKNNLKDSKEESGSNNQGLYMNKVFFFFFNRNITFFSFHIFP